jgi:hypothetical protein
MTWQEFMPMQPTTKPQTICELVQQLQPILPTLILLTLQVGRHGWLKPQQQSFQGLTEICRLTCLLSPVIWQNLLALSDTADRPLFPQIGPMNAFGNLAPGQANGNAFGLQVVVDRNFTESTLIVGDPSGFEIFEQQKGAISIDVPSTLSRTLAFRGYFATLMIDNTKFVKASFV